MKIRLIPNRPIYVNLFGRVSAYTFISAVPFFGEQQLTVRERFGNRNVVKLITINGYVSNRLEYNVITRRGEIPVSARICKTPRSAAKSREVIGDARKRPPIKLIVTDPDHVYIEGLLRTLTANIDKDAHHYAIGVANALPTERTANMMVQDINSARIMLEMFTAPQTPKPSNLLLDTSFSINHPKDIIRIKDKW